MAEPKKSAGKAAPDKGAAARAEIDDSDQDQAAGEAAEDQSPQAEDQAEGTREFEWGELKLTIPKLMPFSTLFDMVESEASSNQVSELIVNLRTLRSIVGTDQFMLIRNTIGDSAAEVISLVNALLATYGLTMGESEVSPGS
jgi:hypothetical protein